MCNQYNMFASYLDAKKNIRCNIPNILISSTITNEIGDIIKQKSIFMPKGIVVR